MGKELVLGNRATTTDSEVYDEERRFSDLTYSGIYNPESNINKLNEFNLGLLNFKPLESSFGPIMKLFSRQTDILTLQEDKISYVQSGKNLLSDAVGGGAIVSIPEVLGLQIARVEEYGISNNPESFAQFGSDKYFTDAKRGSVIQLRGGMTGSDELNVISLNGMKNWFRDLFNVSFETQKLGGFDPYMNEYILSSNTIALPADVDCINCGTTQTISITSASPYSLCYNLGGLVGDVDIDYDVVAGDGSFNITSNYNGTNYSSGDVSTSGVLTFDKGSVSNNQAIISITAKDFVTINLTVRCPEENIMNIILVTLTSNSDAADVIHNEYRWVDGTFTSPLHSEQVYFASGTHPVISSYSTITGAQGGGVIPSNSANVTMISNKYSSDTFKFDILTDNFRYLRSNTLYQNNQADINLLLAASTEATPISGPTIIGTTQYNANFAMPASGSNLYLIWDYTNSTELELCYGRDEFDACCVCAPAEATTASLIFDGISEQIEIPSDASLQFSGAFTISFWIYGTNFNYMRNKTIAEKPGEWFIRGNNTTQLYIRIFTNGNNYLQGRLASANPDSQWNNYIISYDGATSFDIFRNNDGLGGNINTQVGTFTGITPNANPLTIGGDTPCNLSYFSLWNRELTNAEKIELYNSGALLDIASLSFAGDCISWYRLDQTNDLTISNGVADEIGSNEGTALNMTAANIDSINYPT